MAEQRIGVGVVGIGWVAHPHIDAFLKNGHCDVVALCDADPKRAERRAREWGIAPKIYADYAQVLDNPMVDAVELLTPTYLHAEQIVAGLGAGTGVA